MALYLTPYAQTDFIFIKEVNVNDETSKDPEGNMCKYLSDLARFGWKEDCSKYMCFPHKKKDQ